MTARDEILEAARRLESRGLAPFAPADVLRELRSMGSTYPDTTLRTFVVSVMCVNAPSNHAVRYPDLERVGHGQYRLAETAGDPPISSSELRERQSDRASRRDIGVQEQVLTALASGDGQLTWPFASIEDGQDARWQLDDLQRRGYLRIADEGGDVLVALTRAGRRAAERGLEERPTTRRSELEPHELELLHQIMWDASDLDSEEAGRRRHTHGVKWILEEHFHVATSDRGGPQGKPRRDALSRLEDIGAIEPIGGGRHRRTGVYWVTDPGRVQYPW